jgi:hypothetical protein
MNTDMNTDTKNSTSANSVLLTAWQVYCLLNKLPDCAVCIDIVRKPLEILLVTICPLSCLPIPFTNPMFQSCNALAKAEVRVSPHCLSIDGLSGNGGRIVLI